MSSSSFVAGAFASVKEKGPKYMAVSVVNVIVGQGLLLLFHAVLHWNQALANALAVCISAVPAYYLSRAWVWGRTGKSHFKTEVLPFWIFVGIGLVFSTAMVALVSHLTGAASTPASQLTLAEKLLPNLVNAASFFLLWIVRFFLFEKHVHRQPGAGRGAHGRRLRRGRRGPRRGGRGRGGRRPTAGPTTQD